MGAELDLSAMLMTFDIEEFLLFLEVIVKKMTFFCFVCACVDKYLAVFSKF
jgi:hypothetical protein